jgi:hypothetical protein
MNYPRPFGGVRGRVGGSINRVNLEAFRDHARASILDVNDGITSAVGIAEGLYQRGRVH